MTNERLQRWALLAEIVGGISIVASLIFVGVEVRDNSRINEINAFQNLVTEMSVLNRMMVENRELQELERKILFTEETELTAQEVNLLRPYLRAIIRMGQLAFIQYENDVIDEQSLLSALTPVIAYTRQNEVRPFVNFFGDAEYENYVTSIIGRFEQ